MTLTLPPEGSYTPTELTWIDTEPAGLFPMGQDSFWGQMRKVFCDYMQTEMFDKLAVYYNNLDPRTCDEDDIANWEITYGVPVDESKELLSRIAFIEARGQQGPFTRSRRRAIVEMFIRAVDGTPLMFFRPEGTPFTVDGIPFGADDFDLSSAYEIVEDIPNFTYDVRVLESIGIDEPGLYRELKRITPAPIDDNFTVTQVLSL